MPDQLRIASYNVHKAVGVDYRRSPERIARVIASLKADIVALQEVDRRLAPRPAVLSAASILRESGLSRRFLWAIVIAAGIAAIGLFGRV